ncbi:MAG: peptidyl-tRNA hydrolase, partial [Treponema sp.]|nr:peptidyl-tRNA hydrolase [Treponema sp.]
MIRLAVFLGNPGAEHERNRHNAGRLLLERFPPARDFSWRREFQGRFTQAGPPPAPWLLLPETYMNLSGRSVRAAAAYYKIPPAEILAVHDELELPLG